MPSDGLHCPARKSGDDKVSVVGATLALRIAVWLIDGTPEQQSAADVNGDGRGSVADVTKILAATVGLGGCE